MWVALKSGVFVEDLFFFLMEEFYVMLFSTVKFSNTEDLYNYLTWSGKVLKY